jgi:hypothetical protein
MHGRSNEGREAMQPDDATEPRLSEQSGRRRTTWSRRVALGLFAVLAGCGAGGEGERADAASVTDPRAPDTTARFVSAFDAEDGGPAGERIVARPPVNWELSFQSVNPGLRLVEFRPDRETAEVDEQLTFESFNADRMPEPLEALAGIAAEASAACADFEHFNTFAGEENNYPTAVALLVCRDDTIAGGPRITMVKAIKGNEYFYVIHRSRSVPPFTAPDGEESSADLHQQLSEAVGGLSLYMRSVSLCDDHRPEEHPCGDQKADS